MLTLGNIFVLMLLATGGAWLWHNHGLRERALAMQRRSALAQAGAHDHRRDRLTARQRESLRRYHRRAGVQADRGATIRVHEDFADRTCQEEAVG